MGIFKKRVNDFPTPYTCTRAIREGGLETKLSMILMGLGNIVHGQKIKGLLYLAVEVAYVVFMAVNGIGFLRLLGSLGTVPPGRILGRDASGVYVYKGRPVRPDPALRSGDRAPDCADVPCMARGAAQRVQGGVSGQRGKACE